MSVRARHGAVMGCAIALAAGVPAEAGATQVMAMDLAELVAEADAIVVARVVEVRAAWDRGRRRIHGTIGLAVEDAWKGASRAGDKVTIVQPGGAVGDVEMRIHGTPAWTSGERALLFLRGGARAQVLGMAQGKRALKMDARTRVWMVEPSDRGAVVERDTAGVLRPAPPVAAVALAEMKRRVLDLIAAPPSRAPGAGLAPEREPKPAP